MRTKLSRKLTFSILIFMCVFVSLISCVRLVQNDDEQSKTVLGEVTSEPEIIASQEVRGHKALAFERDGFSKQKLYEEETAELGPIELVGVPSQTSPLLMEKATEPKERAGSLKVESNSDVQTLTPISLSQSITSLSQAATRPPRPGEPLSRSHRVGSVITAPGKLVISEKVYNEGENLKTYAIGTAEVTAPVVFDGDGSTEPEFDVKGKLLVRILPPQGAIQLQVINAVKRGAAGLLLIADESHYIWGVSLEGVGLQYIFDSLFGNLIAPIRTKMATFPGVFITPEIAKDFELKSTATLRTQVTIKQRKTMNVVGLVEGSDPSLKKEVVIIGAHFDHVGVDKDGKAFPGASDNASGVAGILEIARAFASAKVKCKRSILFLAFTGEEPGWRIGSEYYVKHPLIPLEKTVAMFNLDIIGTPGFPTVVGEKGAVPMRDIAEQASKIIGVDLKYLCDGAKIVALSSDGREIVVSHPVRDHITFRDKKVPTFYCTSGIYPDIHQTTDTWDKLDPVKLEEIARLDFLVAWGVAQSFTVRSPSATP